MMPSNASALGPVSLALSLALSLAPEPLGAQQCPPLAPNLLPDGRCVAEPEKSCSDGRPAFAAVDDLWGELEPVAAGQLPAERDITRHNGFLLEASTHPVFVDLDRVGNNLVTAMYPGFHVWNLSDPENPTVLKTIDTHKGDFLNNPGGAGEQRFFYENAASLDAGGKSYYVLGGNSGLTIWNLTQPSAPQQLYHDHNQYGVRRMRDAWLARIGSTDWVFSAFSTTGIDLYDLTQASNSPCPTWVNTLSGENVSSCPGIHRGKIATALQAQSVAGADNFLFVSYGLSRGLQIFDVAQPTSAQSLGNFFPGVFISDIEVWKDAGQYLLALHTLTSFTIYNATACVTQGSCSSLPAVYADTTLSTEGWTITYSTAGGRRFLFLGHNRQCNSGPGIEKLYDVTSLGNVHDITPRPQTAPSVVCASNSNCGGATTKLDYWNWYYSAHRTGFAFVQPRVGLVGDSPTGPLFYRAAKTIFDVHRIVNANPRITISGPATVWKNDVATFTASIVNCAVPGQFNWSPGPGGQVLGTSGDSADLSWNTSGQKTVSATHTGCFGANTTVVPLSVQVDDPEPTILSMAMSGQNLPLSPPAQIQYCTSPVFSAAVTGRPTLGYNWLLKETGGSDLLSSSTSTLTFPTATTVSPPVTPLALTIELDLSSTNATPPAFDSRSLLLMPPETLGFDGNDTHCSGPGPCLTQTPAGSGNLMVYANARGASEYRWRHRATGAVNWILDQNYGQGGPSAALFLPLGNWEVEAGIRNCFGEEQLQAMNVSVTIEIAPNALFTPVCGLGICSFSQGATVTFNNLSDGPIETYQYDFEHTTTNEATCSFGSPSTLPLTQHSYSFTGTFHPCLRVNGPGGSDVYVYSSAGGGGILVNPSSPPSIQVSCSPGSVATGAATFCQAIASNCSPGASGWGWTTTGGDGTSQSSSIQLSWSSTGSKTVRATNSSCGTAAGTSFVNVTGGGGGGELAAVITAPAQVSVGDVVDLSASSSTGSIVSYLWTINKPDSSTLNRSGVSTSFTADQAGAYQVILRVASVTGCITSGCSRSVTRTINADEPLEPAVPKITITPSPVSVGRSATLSAEDSTGDIFGYSWTIQPPSGDAVNRAGEVVQHTFTQLGNHVITLRVASQPSCGNPLCFKGTSTTINVLAGVEANFTYAPTALYPGREITFDGRPTTGQIETFRWSVEAPGGGITQLLGEIVKHTFGVPGLHKVTLEADAGCADPSCKDTTEPLDVTVFEYPQASFTQNSDSPVFGQVVRFDANSSTGHIESYTWTVTPPSGPDRTFEGKILNYTFDQVGIHGVRLRVSAGCSFGGCTSSAFVGIRAVQAVADFVINPSPVFVNTTVAFDARSSRGDISEYLWTLTDPDRQETSFTGPLVQNQRMTKLGSYKLRLELVGPCGVPTCGATRTLDFTVHPRVAADFTLTPSPARINVVTTLDASPSLGPVLSYDWTLSGPGGELFEYSGESVEHIFASQGSYTIELVVAADCTRGVCSSSKTSVVEVGTDLVADFVYTPLDAPAGTFITLDASLSTGSPDRYEWNWGEGPVVGQVVGVKFDRPGTIDVTLTISRGGSSHSITKPVTIMGECRPSETTLCLHQGRIEVTVDYDTGTETGQGKVRPEHSESAGLFWFFNPANIELLTKVLDACDVNNHFWVLSAGTTTMGYEIRVRDTISDLEYSVANPVGTASMPHANVEALPICDATSSSVTPKALSIDRNVKGAPVGEWAALRTMGAIANRKGVTAAFCEDSDSVLCLLDGRYRADIEWRDADGNTGLALPVTLESSDSGLYYFFDTNNWEMLVKMVPGCGFNGHNWVFAAATTDQGYTLRITDQITGEERVYENPVGTLAPALVDIEAFTSACTP